ncbi:MAG TPA: phage terminase large subunit, partial [Pyrinomonadaceae bacterium]
VASAAYKQDPSPPSEAHEDKSVLTPPTDPLGRAPGEALCPDRFTTEDLLRIKRKLGSYSFSALYQQRPTPPEGGLFKRAWFTRIVNRPPENLRWCRGYDLAISTKESADFTASFRCALDKQTGDLYIADGFRKRIEFPEQKRFIIERIRTERNTEHGIEHALHAQAFVQELRRQPGLITRPIRLVRPAHDKFTRALSWANLAEEGKVVLVRGTSTGANGTDPAFRQPNWIDAFLEEITTFPNSTHDDQLDAVSIAVSMLERHKNAFHAF